MNMTPAIESAGFGISGSIGGIPRTIYYTPDGRIKKAIPQMRDYVVKDKEGKVIKSGTRDANLDKGWLLYMPKEKKLFCPTCDMWHDTQIEVDACKVAQGKMIEKMFKKARKEEVNKTESLEQKVAELTALVEKLLEGKK